MSEYAGAGTHFVEYADGTFAEYFKKQIILTEDGIKKWRFWLRPGLEIREAFGLIEGEDLDPRTGIIVKEYDYNDVHLCREDPAYGRVWVFTNFEGDSTSLSTRDEHLKEQIRNLHRQVLTLKVNAASMQEDMKKFMENKRAYFKEFMDIVVEAQRGRKRTVEEEEDMMRGGYSNDES